MKHALILGALMAHAAAHAAPPPDAVLAVAASAPAIMISAHTALRMKRELDTHALFLDVDAWANAGSTLRIDAHVPLQRYDAPETYHDSFLGGVDQALAAKGLAYTDGVVIVSRSPRTALEAAELMKEHGYTLLFAVTAP